MLYFKAKIFPCPSFGVLLRALWPPRALTSIALTLSSAPHSHWPPYGPLWLADVRPALIGWPTVLGCLRQFPIPGSLFTSFQMFLEWRKFYAFTFDCISKNIFRLLHYYILVTDTKRIFRPADRYYDSNNAEFALLSRTPFISTRPAHSR